MAVLATWFTPSLSVISRSKGSSSVASAAYRACVKLYDKFWDKSHDYTPKKGHLFTALFGDFNGDLEALWNAAEAADTRKNSRTAREIMIPLPDEWNEEQRKLYVKAVSEMLMIEYGVAGQFSLHAPNKRSKNFHVHILFTTREVKNSEFGKKTRILDEGKKNGEVTNLRNRIADIMNKFAEKFGSDFFVTGGKFVEFDENHIPTKNIPINATPELRAEIEEYNKEVIDARGLIAKIEKDIQNKELENKIVHKVHAEYLAKEEVKKNRLAKSVLIENVSQIDEISSSVMEKTNFIPVESLSPAPSENLKPIIDENVSSQIVEIKPSIIENLQTNIEDVDNQDEYFDIEAEAFRIKNIFDRVREKRKLIKENSRNIDLLKSDLHDIESYKSSILERAFESIVHFTYPLLDKMFGVNDPIAEREQESLRLRNEINKLKTHQTELKTFCTRPDILEACTKWQCDTRYREIIEEFRKQSPDYKKPVQQEKKILPISNPDYSNQPYHVKISLDNNTGLG